MPILAFVADITHLGANFCGIAEAMDVEVYEVRIILQESWKLAPSGVLTGIETVNKDN